MTVHSSTPTSTQQHKESAIVSRARLRKQRGSIERWTAWVVLFVSFLGTIVWLAGGWPRFLAELWALNPHLVSPILGGCAIQGLLTFLEWYYADRPLIAWGARVIDAYTTAVGYGPLVIVWLTGALADRAVPLALWVAWSIVGLVSLVTAWYPESRLVD
jgi:hypothetical protein